MSSSGCREEVFPVYPTDQILPSIWLIGIRLMKFRTLGRTGLQISRMSQGGAAFGEQYGKVSQSEIQACVQRGIDDGINLFDTSPYYGLTRAETILGDALQNGLRQKIYLCSKAGR